MKFFVDTANINEIREAAAMGVLDGVTTTLLSSPKRVVLSKKEFWRSATW
jgi:hypothetical protein